MKALDAKITGHEDETEGPSPYACLRETEDLLETMAREQFDRMIGQIVGILERRR